MENKRKTPIDTEHKNENFRSKHNVLFSFLYLIASLTPFRSFFVREIGTVTSWVVCDVISRGFRARSALLRGSRARAREREGRSLLLPADSRTCILNTRSNYIQKLQQSFIVYLIIYFIERLSLAFVVQRLQKKTMETLMFDMLSDCFLLPKN